MAWKVGIFCGYFDWKKTCFRNLCPFYLSWCLKTAASDYFQFDDLLTPEEQAIKKKVRECMEKNIAPIMTEVCFCDAIMLLLFGRKLVQYNIVDVISFLISITPSHCFYVFSSVLGEGQVPISCYSKAWCIAYCWWHNQGSLCIFSYIILRYYIRSRELWASSDSQGYGCPGLSITGSAIAIAEVARVDASCSTFILVHSSLAMLTIGSTFVSQ